MEGRRLTVWMGRGDALDAPVPKPTPGQVLYAHPNPDGTRKSCGNCVMWMADMEQCHIHDSDVSVLVDAICGYHVFGTPMTGVSNLSRENMDPVEPELSGLERVPGGISCDRCKYYVQAGQQQGKCRAVRVTNAPEAPSALVASLGCCTLWTEKEE